jgi:hypothetical protein
MRPVGLTFAHKQKFIARLLKKRSDGEQYNLMLPHIGVTMTGMKPAPELARGGNLLPLYRYVDNTGATQKLYASTPFVISFTVSLIALHMSEISQMIEQILPEYQPYKNITIREFDYLPEFTRDVKVLLTNTTPHFVSEVLENDLPRVEFDLAFDVPAWIYRPLLTSEIIKSVKIELQNNVTEKLLSTYTYAVSGDDSSSYSISADEWIDEP